MTTEPQDIRKKSTIIREVWFRKRRHPICPKCKHDLLGTVVEGLRKCPECGREFEPSELPSSPAPEDWTLKKGIERAALTLLVRSTLVFFLWYAFLVTCVLVWSLGIRIMYTLAMFPPLALSEFMWEAIAFGVVAFAFCIAVLLGFVFGAIMSRRLTETIGMVGFSIIVAVSSSFILALAACNVLAEIYLSVGAIAWEMSIVSGAIGFTIIIRTMLLDD